MRAMQQLLELRVRLDVWAGELAMGDQVAEANEIVAVVKELDAIYAGLRELPLARGASVRPDVPPQTPEEVLRGLRVGMDNETFRAVCAVMEGLVEEKGELSRDPKLEPHEAKGWACQAGGIADAIGELERVRRVAMGEETGGE